MDEEIFRISRDRDRADDLFEMAKERLELIEIIPKDKTYKIIEEFYEVIKELLTAVMYLDGYKTLSHVKLLEYFSSNYDELDEKEIKLIDRLRRLRNGILYYGRRIGKEFLINNEEDVRRIIEILIELVGRKLKSDQ